MKQKKYTDLSRLLPLLDAQVAACEMKLRVITNCARELEDRLETLLPPETGPNHQSQSIHVLQNNIDHLRWIDGRRAAINIELAKNRTLTEMAKADLRCQWTRRDSLKRLIKGLPSDRGLGDDYGS